MKLLSIIASILVFAVSSYSTPKFPDPATDGRIARQNGNAYEYQATSNKWATLDSDSIENIIYYGAICDGTTDNTNAIQDAIDAAVTSGRIVYAPSCDSTYSFASQITNPEGVPMYFDGTLTFTGSGVDAIHIGKPSAETYLYGKPESKIDLRRATVNYADVHAGIVVENILYWNAKLNVYNFHDGLVLWGHDFGCAYNHIKFDNFKNNRYGMRLKQTDTTGQGWVTQNTFYEGNFSNYANPSMDIAALVFEIAGLQQMNNNVFYNPTYQYTQENALYKSFAVYALYTSGSGGVRNNDWFGTRWEPGSGSTNAYLFAGSFRMVENRMFLTYGYPRSTNNDMDRSGVDKSTFFYSATASDIPYLQQNYVIAQTDAFADQNVRKLVDVKRSDFTQTASGIWAPGDAIFHRQGTLTSAQPYTGADITLAADYVSITDPSTLLWGPAVEIDVSAENRDFKRKVTVVVETVDANGAIGVDFRDAGGALITGTDYKWHPFRVVSNGFQRAENFEKLVTMTDVYIPVNAATLTINITNNTVTPNQVKLKRFEVIAPAGARMSVIKGASLGLEGAVANAIPTETTAQNGKYVMNSDPDANEPLGWVYDVTAGAWREAVSSVNSITTQVNGAGSTTYTTESDGDLFVRNTGNNVGIGKDVLLTNTSTNSSAFGFEAGYNSTSGTQALFGYQTGYANNQTGLVAMGYRAGYNNTGGSSTLIGYNAGYGNTQPQVVALGHSAGYNNAGSSSTMVGYGAGYASASGLAAFGVNSGRYNRGSGGIFLGALTGQHNLGANNTAVGYNAISGQSGATNTAIGYSAFLPVENAGGAKTFATTDVNISTDQITINAHGFGAPATYVSLKITTTGTVPGGLTAGSWFSFLVVDVNTIQSVVDLTSVGTGTHTATPQTALTNSTAVGANAQPTTSNQVMLGGSSVTHVKTYGGIEPASKTSDPCGTFPPKVLFYNETSNYYCFCTGAGADVQMHSPATPCF